LDGIKPENKDNRYGNISRVCVNRQFNTVIDHTSLNSIENIMLTC